MKILTGDTIEIPELIEFEFYDLYWYWDNKTDNIKGKIGRWFGVSHRVGNALCYWVLTEKGNIVVRTTVQHVTWDKAKNPEIQQIMGKYHMTLESAIGADEFMSYLYGMDALIKEEVP